MKPSPPTVECLNCNTMVTVTGTCVVRSANLVHQCWTLSCGHRKVYRTD